MLTGLKVSPVNVDFTDLNIMQRGSHDEKNGVICLFILFTLRVMVIKMSKMAHFLHLLLMTVKKISHSLGKIIKCIWKILFSYLKKCNGLLGSEQPLITCKLLKKQDFSIFWLISFFYISTPNIWQTVTPKAINHTSFWKNLMISFKCT